MRLTDPNLDNELTRRKIAFFTLLNGYLSLGLVMIMAYAIYKLIGVFV